MELVDMLGLGSSSEKSGGSSPFFGNQKHRCLLTINFVKKREFLKRKK